MKLGLQEKSGGNKVFLVIKHDTLCQESKVERPGFEPVEVTNPQTEERSTKYIKRYGSVAAFITKIEWRDTGEQFDQRYTSWRIHLDMGDDAPRAVLEIPFQSRHSSRFMKLAENIDFKRPVEFRAWYDAKGKSTAFFVGQWENENDEKSASVPQKYTRENPNGCPEPVERLGGKWNFDDQTEFLHARMMDVVIPAVEAAQAGREFQKPDEQTMETTAVPSEAPSRESLVKDVLSLCATLNEASDSIKWASPSLKIFVNDTYSVQDGLESLSTEYMGKLKALLAKRLNDLEVPF